MVTKLSGISSFGIDCVTLARDCQKKYVLCSFNSFYHLIFVILFCRFACSASIAASSTRINTMEIAIQARELIKICVGALQPAFIIIFLT